MHGLCASHHVKSLPHTSGGLSHICVVCFGAVSGIAFTYAYDYGSILIVLSPRHQRERSFSCEVALDSLVTWPAKNSCRVMQDLYQTLDPLMSD